MVRKKERDMFKVPRNAAALIDFENIGLGFKSEYILLGKTKSGRYKLGEISGSGPEGYDVSRTRYTTVKKKGKKTQHWLYDSGSPLNSFVREE